MRESQVCKHRLLIVASVMLAAVLGCITQQSGSGVAPAVPVSSAQPGAPQTTITYVPTAVAATPIPSPTLTATPFPIAEGSALAYYRLPLVVQHVTDTSAVVFFELDAPTPGVLLYRVAGVTGPQIGIPLEAAATRHQLTLDGLQPDTDYQVIVALQDNDGLFRQPGYVDEGWGPVQFRTHMPGSPLRVGVLGDSGFGDPVTYGLISQMAGQNLNFVLHTGDTVYQIYDDPDPNEAFTRKWYLPLAPLLHHMPVYTVVGNHDIEVAAMWEGQPYYYHAFPDFAGSAFEGRRQWYAISYGDVQFLMLDSQTFFGEAGRTEQDAWLAGRLADPAYRVTIPVFHVAPYTSGLHTDDGIAIRQQWIPQFEAANVPLILNGHDHNYERLTRNGITYIVTGGGSAVLYGIDQRLPESQLFLRENHFVTLDISATIIKVQVFGLNSNILDELTIPLD